MTDGRRYFAPAEFEHGLRCIECMRPFVEQDEIRERPYAMTTIEGNPVICVELVCVMCEEATI